LEFGVVEEGVTAVGVCDVDAGCGSGNEDGTVEVLVEFDCAAAANNIVNAGGIGCAALSDGGAVGTDSLVS